MTRFVWPSVEEVISVHDASVARFGGLSGLRNAGLLNAALARPFASFAGVDAFPDDVARVCAMVHAIISSHPFADGNKRTGAAVLGMVLRANGLRFKPRHDELLQSIMGIASGALSLEEFTAWVREQVD